jgi:hypothetical protein
MGAAIEANIASTACEFARMSVDVGRHDDIGDNARRELTKSAIAAIGRSNYHS